MEKDPRTHQIIGAAMTVDNEMGPGHLEAVYHECLEKELAFRGIHFESQREIRLIYKGEILDLNYKPDLVCYGKIIVELKAAKDIEDIHRAQVFNYLKATSLRLGLLANFGHFPKATVERIVL